MLFAFPAVHAWSRPASPSVVVASRRAAVQMAGSALIIQNKGGGHGEIGYHLALQLVEEKGMDVTILHEGPNQGKPPHNSYGDLDSAGVKVIWRDDLTDSAACIEALGGASFGAVVDNWSKKPEHIKPYAELAKGMGVSSYCYISSAGMYTPANDDAIAESCAVKTTGQREAEQLIAAMGLPYSCFRPQYIYGPKQGKSYLSYFFDRVTNGQPVLVPNGGDQCVTITHAADNAAMVAAAVGNPAAAGEVFNCATSDLITYDELAALCASAAGVPATIEHYNPKEFEAGTSKKLGFPFRETAFYVSADKAKALLGFAPKHTIKEDIAWYLADNYASKAVDFSKDQAILAEVRDPARTR